MSGRRRPAKSPRFYVRQRTFRLERAETAAGLGDGPTGETLGGRRFGYCDLCAIYNDGNGEVMRSVCCFRHNICFGQYSTSTSNVPSDLMAVLFSRVSKSPCRFARKLRDTFAGVFYCTYA